MVTLSAENDNKLLEQLKSGFRITIKWNKYMSQMSNQNKNNNSNYLIDPTFSNVNRYIEETYEKIIQITDHSGYYTRGNLLDYEYLKEHYKLIASDLSKQIELENKDIKQKINFIGNLERDNGAAMFFIIEKSEETILDFLQSYASIV